MNTPCQSPAHPCHDIYGMLSWLGAVVKACFLFQQLRNQELGLQITKSALEQLQGLRPVLSSLIWGVPGRNEVLFQVYFRTKNRKWKICRLGIGGDCMEPGARDLNAVCPLSPANRELCSAFCSFQHKQSWAQSCGPGERALSTLGLIAKGCLCGRNVYKRDLCGEWPLDVPGTISG